MLEQDGPTIADLPPHNADAERYVLGSLMAQPGDVFQLVDGLLTPEDFYVERHARLFELLGNLWADGTPLEITAITQARRSATRAM